MDKLYYFLRFYFFLLLFTIFMIDNLNVPALFHVTNIQPVCEGLWQGLKCCKMFIILFIKLYYLLVWKSFVSQKSGYYFFTHFTYLVMSCLSPTHFFISIFLKSTSCRSCSSAFIFLFWNIFSTFNLQYYNNIQYNYNLFSRSFVLC